MIRATPDTAPTDLDDAGKGCGTVVENRGLGPTERSLGREAEFFRQFGECGNYQLVGSTGGRKLCGLGVSRSIRLQIEPDKLDGRRAGVDRFQLGPAIGENHQRPLESRNTLSKLTAL